MTQLLLASPVGPLIAEYDTVGVRALRAWPQGTHPPAGVRDAAARDDTLGADLQQQLREYFAGERQGFDLPLLPVGTPFQQQVWQALAHIPFGETRSYIQVAREVERPGGAIAVGQANARNPLLLVVPCHRVLASGNKLGGYGPGVEVKRWLLRHEGVAGW